MHSKQSNARARASTIGTGSRETRAEVQSVAQRSWTYRMTPDKQLQRLNSIVVQQSRRIHVANSQAQVRRP